MKPKLQKDSRRPDSRRELSADEAKRLILLILKEGRTIGGRHYHQDRKAERNAPMQDILHVLRTGEVVRNPEWNEEYQNWTCKVAGFDLEDEELKVVTAIIEEDLTLFIITVTS